MNQISAQLSKRDVVAMIRGTIPNYAMKAKAIEMGIGNDFYAEWEWFAPDMNCWAKYSAIELYNMYIVYAK